MDLDKLMLTWISIGLIFYSGTEAGKLLNRVEKIGNALNKQSTITRAFHDHGYARHNINIDFQTYLSYKNRSNANDSLEDIANWSTPNAPELKQILEALKIQGRNKELDAQNILDFVHEFDYIPDEDQYAKTPIETIVEGGGDCEDLSILTYSLLTTAGIDAVYIHIPPHGKVKNGHILVGIAGKFDGTSVNYKGKKYYLAETTGGARWYSPRRIWIGELLETDWINLKGITVFKHDEQQRNS